MLMQIGMVPGIFDWTENAPINPNKNEEDESEESEETEDNWTLHDSNTENHDGDGDFLASGLLTFWAKFDFFHPEYHSVWI